MGRNARLAKHFGLTAGAISHWRRNGVPLARMKSVRAFTQGKVSLEGILPNDVLPARGTVPGKALYPANLPGAI